MNHILDIGKLGESVADLRHLRNPKLISAVVILWFEPGIPQA